MGTAISAQFLLPIDSDSSLGNPLFGIFRLLSDFLIIEMYVRHVVRMDVDEIVHYVHRV